MGAAWQIDIHINLGVVADGGVSASVVGGVGVVGYRMIYIYIYISRLVCSVGVGVSVGVSVGVRVRVPGQYELEGYEIRTSIDKACLQCVKQNKTIYL